MFPRPQLSRHTRSQIHHRMLGNGASHGARQARNETPAVTSRNTGIEEESKGAISDTCRMDRQQADTDLRQQPVLLVDETMEVGWQPATAQQSFRWPCIRSGKANLSVRTSWQSCDRTQSASAPGRWCPATLTADSRRQMRRFVGRLVHESAGRGGIVGYQIFGTAKRSDPGESTALRCRSTGWDCGATTWSFLWLEQQPPAQRLTPTTSSNGDLAFIS